MQASIWPVINISIGLGDLSYIWGSSQQRKSLWFCLLTTHSEGIATDIPQYLINSLVLLCYNRQDQDNNKMERMEIR